MRRTALALTLGLAAGPLLAGCGQTNTADGPSSTSSMPVSGTINVFAAASLKESFTQLGQRFEVAHPGVRVVLNFGPSSGLAAQITQGAPADVFASASDKNMDQVVTAGAAASPRTFASNAMAIAVPAGNPAKITGLSDLAKSDVKVALCQSAVPCGASAVQVLANAQLTVTPVTEEVDVRAVLTKVSLGEVDAGLVYLTDVRAAAAKVEGITIPTHINASTHYPIATLSTAPNKHTAEAFADYILSPEGAGVLATAGFAKP